jgi:hypothetical protein
VVFNRHIWVNSHIGAGTDDHIDHIESISLVLKRR